MKENIMFETRQSSIPLLHFGEEASYSFLETGDIYEFRRTHFLINQLQTGLTEESVQNIYLRIYEEGNPIRLYPLTGSAAFAAPEVRKGKLYCGDHLLRFETEAEGIRCRVDFLPGEVNRQSGDRENIWFWQVSLEGKGKLCDLVYLQDLGVADEGALRSNILYQSQYLGHHIQEGKCGYRMASRQNMEQGGSYPMVQQGCLDARIVSYATDAFQIFGRANRKERCPRALYREMLPGEVYQYELACAALQTEKFRLEGEKQVTFYGYFCTDCQDPDDQEVREERAAKALALLARTEEGLRPVKVVRRSVAFGVPYASPAFTPDEVERLFPERRLEEKEGEELLSFFAGEHRHVVLQEKDVRTERFHGHILVTLPNSEKVDKELLAATNYMHGIFASQLVVGNVDSNPLLDGVRDSLNLHTKQGLRIFLRQSSSEGSYHLLTMPAAYEMGLDYSRWYYKLPEDLLTVTSFVAAGENAFTLQIASEGSREYEYLIRMSLALGGSGAEGGVQSRETGEGLVLRPGSGKPSCQYYPELEYTLSLMEGEGEFLTDSCFYEDGEDRDASLLALRATGERVNLLIRGTLGEKEAAPRKIYDLGEEEKKFLSFYKEFLGNLFLEGGPGEEGTERLNELAAWFLHDALIHFAAPHGLEQSGGAAWGTRDVCQGPMELFLTTGHFALARHTLLEIFAHQNRSSGEWPQYFMFDRYPYAAGDCHGDVVFWPLKSLGDYLEATGDYEILACQAPYREDAGCESLLEHVGRAVENVESRFLQGTFLVNYAGGDWDDTLQPSRPEWKEKLCSAWTQALACQVMELLGEQLATVEKEEARRLKELAENMRKDFRRYLVKDGVIAGFILMDGPEEIQYLLHPLDEITGVTLRLLPLTRSVIAGIADPDLAKSNLQLIEKELDFPDGVRLMNRPTEYRGGISVYFKRAEQAANVGREVGLLYVHAHIRYLEALAKMGEGEKLWKGLLKVNPILIRESVPCAGLRQSNAYFSSSDADFKDRYEFSARFEELRTGTVTLKGGWKVYSSGPGIYLTRLIRDLLGIRLRRDRVILDPVLPKAASGWKVHVTLWNKPCVLCLQTGRKGYGARRLLAGGRELEALRQEDLYREGGIVLTREEWESLPEEILVETF